MGRMLLIKKYLEKDNIFYYTVFKRESLDKIDYYIGLDFQNKKIYFFNDKNFEKISAYYDMSLDQFNFIDPEIKSRITAFVMIKATNAIKNKEFLDDISWFS